MQVNQLVLLVSFALSTPAFGQVYKCTGTHGRTVYSDSPCNNGGVTVLERAGAAPEVQNPRSSTEHSPGPYERQLTTRIYEALAQKNFRRAESLAVTEGQWQIINNAKAADAAEKQARAAERRANRPIVCTNSGYQIDGSYLGRSVCR